MLNDASGFRRIYLATGYTDLRRGMEGLASIIKFNFQLDPYQKDILFLFCGRRTDRIKGLPAYLHPLFLLNNHSIIFFLKILSWHFP